MAKTSDPLNEATGLSLPVRWTARAAEKIWPPLYLMSWSLWVARISKPADRAKRASVIRGFNLAYCTGTVALLAILIVLESDSLAAFQPMGFCWWKALLQYLLFSRVIEIFWAFYRDASEKLSRHRSSSDLDWGERVRLALRSYVELIANFALIYLFFPAQAWVGDIRPKVATDIVWYSANVITTSGGGGLVPGNVLLKALSLCEVFCGVILLVVSFTIYTGHALSQQSGDRADD